MNAKQELLDHLRLIGLTWNDVRCLLLESEGIGEACPSPFPPRLVLPLHWSPLDLDALLSTLDVDYDHSFGHQFLTGTIWFSNGTWSTRADYDGSEWWDHHAYPPIPPDLQPTVARDEPLPTADPTNFVRSLIFPFPF